MIKYGSQKNNQTTNNTQRSYGTPLLMLGYFFYPPIVPLAQKGKSPFLYWCLQSGDRQWLPVCTKCKTGSGCDIKSVLVKGIEYNNGAKEKTVEFQYNASVIPVMAAIISATAVAILATAPVISATAETIPAIAKIFPANDEKQPAHATTSCAVIGYPGPWLHLPVAWLFFSQRWLINDWPGWTYPSHRCK